MEEGKNVREAERDEAALFYLLELNDALFPIGAYAHSYGLETYVQEGAVHDRESAEGWLRAYFAGSFLYQELLAARLAYEAMQQEDAAGALLSLEEELRASRTARESREAMEKLGRRLAKNVCRIPLPVGKEFLAYIEEGSASCTHPVCYGALAASLGLPERRALAHYVYAQLSALVNTCVKLIPLSQTDGARLTASFRENFSRLLDKAFAASREDLGLSFPGLDIRGMQHEVLYSRLYMS